MLNTDKDDQEFYVSFLKKFDEKGQFRLPTLMVHAQGKNYDAWAEETRPYLALILRGFARYESGVSTPEYLQFVITEKGRQLLATVAG